MSGWVDGWTNRQTGGGDLAPDCSKSQPPHLVLPPSSSHLICLRQPHSHFCQVTALLATTPWPPNHPHPRHDEAGCSLEGRRMTEPQDLTIGSIFQMRKPKQGRVLRSAQLSQRPWALPLPGSLATVVRCCWIVRVGEPGHQIGFPEAPPFTLSLPNDLLTQPVKLQGSPKAGLHPEAEQGSPAPWPSPGAGPHPAPLLP